MTDNTTKMIMNFATEVMNANDITVAHEMVYKIILAAAHDNDLVSHAMDAINAKFDWAAAIEKVQSNMSEL